VQINWVCPSVTQRCCKNDSDSILEPLTATRVESFGEKRDSSRVRVTTNHDSSRVMDPSHAITADKFKNIVKPLFGRSHNFWTDNKYDWLCHKHLWNAIIKVIFEFLTWKLALVKYRDDTPQQYLRDQN